jgi:EAL domain-containing protein (putative c-di-GMP-specific phosphodiesterase class I)
VLHYQPIFALPSGEVAHLEALVRWQRPDSGLAAPLSFIPLAEESGLIESLGRWVLDALLEQAGEWLGEGRDVRFSFNVSPRQLRRSDFARNIAAAIEQRSLDPARFCVEITESSAMRNSHAVEPLLRELRAAGLRLAVDDFGLGYSSLDRLRDLPFQMLKIDRSFLARTPEDRGCAGIVRAVLELAEALGMEAVAEGVETEEQRRFLEERRCPLAQGFLLSRPLPASEVAALLPAPAGAETASAPRG